MALNAVARIFKSNSSRSVECIDDVRNTIFAPRRSKSARRFDRLTYLRPLDKLRIMRIIPSSKTTSSHCCITHTCSNKVWCIANLMHSNVPIITFIFWWIFSGYFLEGNGDNSQNNDGNCHSRNGCLQSSTNKDWLIFWQVRDLLGIRFKGRRKLSEMAYWYQSINYSLFTAYGVLNTF